MYTTAMKPQGILLLVLLRVAIRTVSCDEAEAIAAARSGEDAYAAAIAIARSNVNENYQPSPPPQQSCASRCMSSSPYYDPLCASDKMTYYNTCYLNCENKYRQQVGLKPLWPMYESSCIRVHCQCSNTRAPVCDVEGNSYYNRCYLECASRQSVVDNYGPLDFYHNGLCHGDPCACPFVHAPLCAFDGKTRQTFGNKCLLGCENEKRKSKGDPLMIYEDDGECDIVIPPKECTDECASQGQFLVCGSNYVTYYNVCYLNCASLKAIQNGQAPISIVKIGRCFNK